MHRPFFGQVFLGQVLVNFILFGSNFFIVASSSIFFSAPVSIMNLTFSFRMLTVACCDSYYQLTLL